MTGGDEKEKGGTSLLLIFSAIDLLSSALVCAIVLMAILVGASEAEVSESTRSAKRGLIVFMVWRSKDTVFEQPVGAAKQGEETQEKPDGAILGLLPKAEKRTIFVTSNSIRMKSNGPIVLEIFGAQPSHVAIVASCAATEEVSIAIYPRISVPYCSAALSSEQPGKAKVGSVVYLPMADDILGRVASIPDVSRTKTTEQDGSFTIVKEVDLSPFSGAWGVQL